MAWVLLGLALLACGSDDEPAAFCEQYCARLEQCSSGATGCADFCAEYQASTVVNDDFLQAIAPCAARSTCADVVSGDYHQKCFEEAADRVTVSAALVESCEEITHSDFECGFRPDLGVCVENTKVYKQEIVEQMLGCARQESCDELVACYERLFE